MKKTALLITTFSFLLLFAAPTYAQSSARVMTVVPPAEQISVNPGETAEGTLKMINDSDEALNFETYIRDYIVEDNQGTPVILPPDTLSNKYSASSWIGVSPTSFVVQPHQRQELTYFIQVPANARPGGHYAAVMYQPTNVIDVKGTGTGVLTYVGTLFYIHVKGDIAEGAEVSKFNAKGFSEYGPVKIETEILNKGDLHIRPKGTITVKNMFGQVVEQKQIDEHNIFPEKSFAYENEFGSKWMFGRYTAQFTGTYGLSGNLPLVASVSFIVFPWKIATVAILVIIIIILAVIYLRRRKKGKKEPEAPKTEETPATHETL